MAERITPRIDALYRREIAGVIKALSKRSTCVAVMPTNVRTCDNCVYDHQHQCSSGTYNGTGPKPFTGMVCPVCRGAGKLSQQRRLTLTANVQWGPGGGDASRPTAQGDLLEGQALIKVLYRDYQTLRQAEYFLIDGIRCKRAHDLPKPGGLRRYATAEIMVEVDQ